MPKKTTKPKKKVDGAEKALKQLSNKRVNEINESLINGNKSELSDFIMRFCSSKDFPLMIKLLVSLQDKPQFFKKGDEFETIYSVAERDGQAKLIRDLTEICIRASEGDRDFIENKLGPTIFK